MCHIAAHAGKYEKEELKFARCHNVKSAILLEPL